MNGNHILKWKVYRTFFLLGPKDYRNFSEQRTRLIAVPCTASCAALLHNDLRSWLHSELCGAPATRRALQRTPAEKALKREKNTWDQQSPPPTCVQETWKRREWAAREATHADVLPVQPSIAPKTLPGPKDGDFWHLYAISRNSDKNQCKFHRKICDFSENSETFWKTLQKSPKCAKIWK